MSLEQLSDPDFSELVMSFDDRYKLIIKDVRIDLLSVVADLYEIDEETYRDVRFLLTQWLLGIADDIEYKDPEESAFGGMGFDYHRRI